MEDLQEAFGRLLSQLSVAVKRLDRGGIEAVLQGRARIKIVTPEDANKPVRHSRKSMPLAKEQCQEIVSSLSKMESREAGEAYLKQVCDDKQALISVAGCLDVPFEKKESVARLTDRIIEATIGFRLRSRAIQGGDRK